MKKLSVASLLAVALSVLAVALLTYSFLAPQRARTPDPDALRQTIEKAATFLASVPLRGDDAWITTQGASRLGPGFRLWAETLNVAPEVETDLGRDPLAGSSIGAGAEGHLWNLRWLEETPLPPLPRPEHPTQETVSTTMSEADILTLLRLMSQAVACNRLGEADRRAWTTQLQANTHGYLLTHQLIALLLGLHQGCIDAGTASPLRADLAQRLWNEHWRDRSGLHDLSIERMAILCYAQVCDWLPGDSLDELVRAQQASGSWGKNLDAKVHPRVVAREEHSAALAFYVLASAWTANFPDAPPPLPPRP